MEGKRHDDLFQDDASIEILSEGGDSHTRDSDWSIYSPSRSSIAGSEMSLVDFQKLSIHSKMATIVHRDGRQFIERRDLDDGGLPYSAEFYLNGEVWKLSGEDCFLMSPRRYIAKVTVEGTVDLGGAVEFEEAVRMLLKHLKVMKVLLDEELEECNKTKSDLVMALDKLTEELEENIDRKRDVMMFRMLLKKHGSSLNMDFKHDLRNCSRLSSEIMSTLDNYVTKALKLIQRNEVLGHLNDSSLSGQFINDAIQASFSHQRARLAAICPPSMKDKLKELPDDRILYVTMGDMHLFTDLITLDEDIFEAVLPMIFSKFLTRVEEINEEQFADLDQLSNRSFLYVCKSMQEIAEQLGTLIKTGNAIIYSEALGWEVASLQEESETSYSKCLRQQLQMLTKLANHFEPGGPFRTSQFPYEFQVFQNMDEIPEPVRIWLCLLDDCIKDLVQADVDKMKMLSCFFKSYVSFIASEDFRSETLECLQTITVDALRSLADMAYSQQDRTTSDSASLEYNKMISCCLDKFPRANFGKECDEIESSLQQIICQAMDMNVSSDVLSKFSNIFKQLLNDLSDLQLEWFIQLTPSDKRSLLLRSQFIVPVDSILKTPEQECFKVVDLEGFVGMYKLLHSNEELPKHYQLKVIQELLQNLEKLASKQGRNDGKHLSDNDLLDAMTDMINAIRSSLETFKEQPDYYHFEDFLLKMTKPCAQLIKEEVQEVPPSDAIETDERMDPLLHRLDDSLLSYNISFNKFITESKQSSREKRIENIVSEVKSKIKPKLASSWTDDFKRNELPEVLAGLSAVWSITGLKNDSSSEMMMAASQTQIGFILNIFKTDESHQLIEISTQEGKELVLGLTAALLALYGHKVQIVCFNSFLTWKKSLDFIEVFRSFAILSNISYESLKDMARERSKGVYEKYTAYIDQCFGIETNSNNDNDSKNASDDERSILLIEDIDIILQEDTMSMPFKRLVMPTVPGLEEVQRRLFCSINPVNRNEIDKYIRHSDNPEFRKLRAFLDRPQSYRILEGSPFEELEYTNKTLFLKHLEAMIKAKTMNEYCSRVSQAVAVYKEYGYLSLGYISIPYAHLVKNFPRVLGFTSAPLDIIGEYFLNNYFGICHTISEPNIFQTNPTKFDPKKDFLYFDSKDERDWMEAIKVAINAATDRNCLVLVFFKGAQKARQLKQTEVNVYSVFKTVTHLENRFDISAEAISLLMVCNGQISKDQQVHVIQTFFSDDKREEDLIRRQAERIHSSGSYELIIPTICNMSRYVLAYVNRKEEITYEWLVKNRQDLTVEEIKLCLGLSLEQYSKIKQFLKL